MAEAAVQFQRALDKLTLPDTRERQRRELEFYSAVGAVWSVAKCSTAPEMGRAYAAARELWEPLGSPRTFFGLSLGSLVLLRPAANSI
jgi:hypothetical protein